MANEDIEIKLQGIEIELSNYKYLLEIIKRGDIKLAIKEIENRIGGLERMKEVITPISEEQIDKIIRDWFMEQRVKYGGKLVISPNNIIAIYASYGIVIPRPEIAEDLKKIDIIKDIVDDGKELHITLWHDKRYD